MNHLRCDFYQTGCYFYHMRKALVFIFYFTCLPALFLSAQTESLVIPFPQQQKWMITDQSNADEIEHLTFAPGVARIDNEQITHSVFPYLVPLSIEQLFERILEKEKEVCRKAKLTVIEKHTGFDVVHPWGIFLIECADTGTKNPGKCSMYLLKKGEHFTFITSREIDRSKLKKLEKSWVELFKNSHISEQSTPTSYKSFGYQIR